MTVVVCRWCDDKTLSLETLVQHLAEVHQYEHEPDVKPLTPRQREIVALIADGLSTTQVAGRLSCSPLTVKTHISDAMRRVKVSTRSGLVGHALRSGEIK